MTEGLKLTDALVLLTSSLSMVAVFAALAITAFIFYRTKQDIVEIAELRHAINDADQRSGESVYISDQIVNVLYDLYELFAVVKAYVELSDAGYKIDERMFRDANRRVSLLEKHFAELGLFSQDEERRKSVQLSLANMFGDGDTLKIMHSIDQGKIGIKDKGIRPAIRTLEGRLRAKELYVDLTSWTGRPSGGAF